VRLTSLSHVSVEKIYIVVRLLSHFKAD